VVEIKDLRRPVQFTLAYAAPRSTRREGRTLRFTPPGFVDFDPRPTFGLETRRLPLVLGVPRSGESVLHLTCARRCPPGRAPRMWTSMTLA